MKKQRVFTLTSKECKTVTTDTLERQVNGLINRGFHITSVSPFVVDKMLGAVVIAEYETES